QRAVPAHADVGQRAKRSVAGEGIKRGLRDCWALRLLSRRERLLRRCCGDGGEAEGGQSDGAGRAQCTQLKEPTASQPWLFHQKIFSSVNWQAICRYVSSREYERCCDALADLLGAATLAN